jgi:hypothetical protein
MEWAEDAGRAAGKVYLRLGCMASNSELRRFYERTGYRYCGDVDRGPRWLQSLYEKRVA